MQVKGRPAGLPDITYQNATAMSKKKSFEGIPGRGSKVFRELFGEINDPRYSIFNAMTNLSCCCKNSYIF